MDDTAAEVDYGERRYLAEFCGACGAAPCTWDGRPDGFHTDEEESVETLTATAPPESITTIDGETRAVTRTWPDGSWDCPFCGGVCDPHGQYYKLRSWPGPCANPACIVGGAGTPERVAQIRLDRQRSEEAASQRAWLHKVQEEERIKREAARQQACKDFAARAREHGYCVECWGRSTSWGMWTGQARIVRHRKPENCPSIRRRRG